MNNTKKPLNIDEQIDRLINFHKLTIENKKIAHDILQSVSYYRLSGYGIGLKSKSNKEEFNSSISFSHIYKLYLFDRELKGIFFDIIAAIEVELKTKISNHLALKYGALEYISNRIFDDKIDKNGLSYHEKLLSRFQYEVERHKNVPFVKHHIDNYNSDFPIWVAVELFSFGNIGTLYDIMLIEDKKEISNTYNARPKHLMSWILALVEVRNICAHDNRLYNMPLKQTPFLYSENIKYRSNYNRLFPIAIIIKKITNNREIWSSFFSKMQCIFKKYEDVVNLAFLGFPENWIDILKSNKVISQ